MADSVNRTAAEFCKLRDGRQLAYSCYGDANGLPAFHCHGTTSSRLEGALYDQLARQHGVRLIAIDRPGAGRSEPLAQRRLSDWADDVAQLANHLGLARYVISGGSGGGAHALACAAMTPGRVQGVVLINTAVPPHKQYWRAMPLPMRALLYLYLYAPGLTGLLVKKMAARRDPAMLRDEKAYARMRRFLPADDRRIMDDKTRRELFADAVAEGLRQDPLMFATEAQIFLGHGLDSWQFDPLTLQVPVIALCGEQDGSPAFCEQLVANAPAPSRLTHFPGGHIAALGDTAGALAMSALRELAEHDLARDIS